MTAGVDQTGRAVNAAELRILDDRGCLTPEAMCFGGQLHSEHRAVVERHVRVCTVCAQQQMDLARVTQRVRAARPRVPVPAEASALARQVAVQSLTRRRRLRSGRGRRATARVAQERRRPPRWHRRRAVRAALIVGLAAAITAAVIAFLWI